MAARARHSTARNAQYNAFDAGEDYAQWDLLPGERIGPPSSRRRGKIVLLGLVAAVALGGWALLSGQLAWPAWLPTDPAIVLAWFDRKTPAPVERAAPADLARTARLEPLATIDVPSSPSSKNNAAIPPALEKSGAPLTTGSIPPSSKDQDTSPEPLPRIAPDPADPYQMKAAAAGLHPGLSRVLLTRLSAADYRNAGTAIETALAETPDSGVHVWPRQRKPELALFRVSFVAGAPPGCRRYVVKITKDGWLTTALPMEKCGTQHRQARRG